MENNIAKGNKDNNLAKKKDIFDDFYKHLNKVHSSIDYEVYSELFDKFKNLEEEVNNTSNLMEVDRDMLIFGMRYALGRQTFAPSTAVENIKRNIDKLDNNTIDIMIRDIEEHPGSLGMECDKRTWLTFKQYLINMKTERNMSIISK